MMSNRAVAEHILVQMSMQVFVAERAWTFLSAAMLGQRLELSRVGANEC
eukprot:CAMPEP_0183598510 /NCGR_PEP_ID=MMETSP0371-20130417/178854_1 /TAXON_ID=268820 /ORGANISM="Peridinium aciculiferum, Strain PAER-2" /LENGTH=48 /DNA_ID= /DNA_START= /DNA_END= /DNA_ORIENTATION=